MGGLFGSSDSSTSDAQYRQRAANALPPSGATNAVRDNNRSQKSIAASGFSDVKPDSKDTLGGGGSHYSDLDI